jgi:hypothetical protein
LSGNVRPSERPNIGCDSKHCSHHAAGEENISVNAFET